MVPVDRSQLRVSPPRFTLSPFFDLLFMEPCFSSSCRCYIGVEGINLWARYSGPKGISLCLFCGIGMALGGCNTWNLWSKREIRRRNYWNCNYVHWVIYIYIYIYVGLLIFLFLFFFFFSFFLSRRFNERKIEFIEWEIAWITILGICRS